MYIIETVGAWGVKTTKHDHTRAATPRPGDLVLFPRDKPEDNREPWSPGKYGRIEKVGTGHCHPDELHVCCTLGSAFLMEDGAVSISGGPFMTMHRTRLEPTYSLTTASFWNWGDNGRGAGQGVDYFLVRPVFLYSPEDHHG